MDLNTLHYAKSHEWAHVEGDICTVGITQHAVDLLTDIIHLELPKVGAAVKAETRFGEVESVKSVNELIAPLSGTVIEVNDKAAKDTSLVNSDPYGAGWLIKIKLAPDAAKSHLMDLKKYEDYCAHEGH
ncbi:glycine cleavage system protein GcvH [Telmatocola sphagniphila]|jgi:glycine cleavage system H protein|uniref:Glycine cleavage system H protein n=1 Tax=Telmatocola sphagniphila TaxID=1123043 RepID=A0A8E6B1B2_9BACT|nr:glycine cleavage system protein GcvH [Telmatocola sphagniphila]QVL30135.1 glycine cleavage system protein GcvH [Telmatocola sphagniphila]